MIRNLVFFSLLWTSLMLSILLFIPVGLIYLLAGSVAARNFAGRCTHIWGKFVVFISGVRLILEGKENLSDTPPVVILSNHQSYMDIPIFMSIYPFPLSFTAKKELMKVPLINLWIRLLGCDLIDRKRPRSVFRKVREDLGQGSSSTRLFFPEGTRSRGPETGTINRGFMRMVTAAEVPVQPVRIEGSYRLYEEKGRIFPGEVIVSLFPVSHQYPENELEKMLSGEKKD